MAIKTKTLNINFDTNDLTAEDIIEWIRNNTGGDSDKKDTKSPMREESLKKALRAAISALINENLVTEAINATMVLDECCYAIARDKVVYQKKNSPPLTAKSSSFDGIFDLNKEIKNV